jgi:hypothetical protein
LGGVAGQSLKLGRMEFIDGTEVTPKDATLTALKRDRIAQRLIGNFGFSDVGRSLDGVQYVLNRSKLNFTLLGARPTRGVFQVDGWGELNANVFYGALTGQMPGKSGSGEWRVFGLGYSDYRDGVVKTDNRPLAMRAANTGHINIGTYGGHYLQTVQSSLGTLDLLAWGAMQTGSWGKLAQRSGAFAAEAGWQPPVLRVVRPWLRGGYTCCFPLRFDFAPDFNPDNDGSRLASLIGDDLDLRVFHAFSVPLPAVHSPRLGLPAQNAVGLSFRRHPLGRRSRRLSPMPGAHAAKRTSAVQGHPRRSRSSQPIPEGLSTSPSHRLFFAGTRGHHHWRSGTAVRGRPPEGGPDYPLPGIDSKSVT